jgi:hypothetical protein
MEGKEGEVVRKWIERNEGDRSPSFLSILILTTSLTTSSPSFLSTLLTTFLPPSSQSSSLPLSFLPLKRKEGEVVRKWMERNEGEVVRRRIERKEGERQTTSLPHSYPSSSLPLFLLPLSHPHYLSPSFLSVILTTSLLPSSQSSSPPLHPSFLSIRHLIPLLSFL